MRLREMIVALPFMLFAPLALADLPPAAPLIVHPGDPAPAYRAHDGAAFAGTIPDAPFAVALSAPADALLPGARLSRQREDGARAAVTEPENDSDDESDANRP